MFGVNNEVCIFITKFVKVIVGLDVYVNLGERSSANRRYVH